MTATVNPSAIKGTLATPASKSQTIRAIAAAMLADGRSVIHHPSCCDDALAMLEIARQMGSTVKHKNDQLEIIGTLRPTSFTFDCGESGLAARLMIALAPALFDNPLTITGKGTLLKRPLGNLCEALQQMGVRCHSDKGKLPYLLSGKMKAGEVLVEGSESSQFVSGLLMALPLLCGESKLIVQNLKSAPYVLMTLETIRKFGIEIKQKSSETYSNSGCQPYTPTEIAIEGDWSGAAFMMVAAALAGDLMITGLDIHSKQADRQIIEAMAAAGIHPVTSGNCITIRQQQPQPFRFDCTHCPDLFPPLAVLAATAQGTSTLVAYTGCKTRKAIADYRCKRSYLKWGFVLFWLATICTSMALRLPEPLSTPITIIVSRWPQPQLPLWLRLPLPLPAPNASASHGLNFLMTCAQWEL